MFGMTSLATDRIDQGLVLRPFPRGCLIVGILVKSNGTNQVSPEIDENQVGVSRIRCGQV